MMQYSYDVAVAWRIYPGVSKVPLIYPQDKWQLVRTCLLSFMQATGELRIRYYFILDGCPPAYRELIESLLPGPCTTILETPAMGNLATFRKQVELLTTQEDAPLVYFAEDDYLYRPGALALMVQLLRQETDVDFVSCYLHADTLSHPIHRHPRRRKSACGHRWFTDSSTCLTFLASREKLIATKDIFLSYSRGNNDCALWLVLTKTHIRNPLAYLRFMLQHQESFGILKMAVKYTFRYFFTGRRYSLWIPDPALGTHLEKGLVSPGIDWLALSREVEERAS